MPRAPISSAEHNRKYGPQHRRDRASWQTRLTRGELVLCWRCGRRVPVAADLWQLGHRDGLPSAPEHSTCNLSDGGRVGNARRWHGHPRRPVTAPAANGRAAAAPARDPRCATCPQHAPNGALVCQFGDPHWLGRMCW